MRRAAGLLLLLGCGGAVPTTQRPAARVAPSVQPTCENTSVAALVARHAERYGSLEAIAASLPRTEQLEVESGAKRSKSSAEYVLQADGLRRVGTLSGLLSAHGIDAQGPWILSPVVGVRGQLKADEAADILFDEWIARRHYMRFAPTDVRHCDVKEPTRIRVEFRSRPDLGTPSLIFDLDGTLREIRAGGEIARTSRIEKWTDAESGVRWPAEVVTRDAHDNETTERLISVSKGTCHDRAGVPIHECLTPPSPALTLTWPPSGEVHVPMRYYLGEISLQVHAMGRPMWALLDSGAGVTVVDATTPASAAFTAAGAITGAAVSQKINIGLGQLESVELGDRAGRLRVEHLPAASVPIPVLDAFGNRRPELILGFSFFAAATIRVDFAKSEVVLQRKSEGAHAANAIAVPVRWQSGGMLADFDIDGARGPVKLDTGNAGGLTLAQWWADAHGIPGARPTLRVTGNSGAGTETTNSSMVRLGRVSLGPVQLDDRIASIEPMPPGGMVSAGLAGNDFFARCQSVTFDLTARTLWLEPPCARPVAESLIGWRLKKSLENAARPWVVERLVPGGSAERGGVQSGDRVLRVDNVPAELDVERIGRRFEQPAGTKVTLEVLRDGKKRTIVLPLVRLLSP